MSKLNYEAYVKSGLLEESLRGLMESEMNARAKKYGDLEKKCGTIITNTQNYIKGAFEYAKDEVISGYEDGGSTLSGIVKNFDSTIGDMDAFIEKLTKYQEMYGDAAKFYKELVAECASKIEEANAKIKAMKSKLEDDEDGSDIKAIYNIHGKVVEYQI